jgi:hypothetical protein
LRWSTDPTDQQRRSLSLDYLQCRLLHSEATQEVTLLYQFQDGIANSLSRLECLSSIALARAWEITRITNIDAIARQPNGVSQAFGQRAIRNGGEVEDLTGINGGSRRLSSTSRRLAVDENTRLTGRHRHKS